MTKAKKEELDLENVYGLFAESGIRFERVAIKGQYKLRSMLRLGDTVRVTDPCYHDIKTWCAYTLKNVLPGPYSCFATVKGHNETGWGSRISEIAIIHLKYTIEIKENDFKLVKGAHIGVDSGQAGFFDFNYFSNLEPRVEDNYTEINREFYDEVCKLTSDDYAGVIQNELGFVSCSGYGDGGYDLYTAKKDGKVVAAKIIFINDKEEE